MPNFDTLFLDRDGVINKKLDGRYVRDFSEFEFMPGALHAISKLSNLFNRIIVVTNQQGISKKIMTDSDLNILHAFMNDMINKAGGKLERIYYCPHLEESDCKCRKPKTGMIDYLKKKWAIHLSKSLIIGDKESDKKLAINSKIKYLILSRQIDLLKILKKKLNIR